LGKDELALIIEIVNGGIGIGGRSLLLVFGKAFALVNDGIFCIREATNSEFAIFGIEVD
jgi:hypothetical protein